MRTHVALLCMALAAVGCKKTGGGTGGGGGGGGGGGWLIGTSGLMVNVNPQGQLGSYELGDSVELSSIACRYAGEAWVTGADGTLLYTNDAGQSWTAQALPLTGDLRAVATQDAGPVFIAGTSGLVRTTDTGASWQQLGSASFRAIAAAQAGDTVLALSEDGGLWSYRSGALVRSATFDGARGIAVSPDGTIAMIAGRGLYRSLDAGATWTQLAVDPTLGFDDLRIAEDGSAVAVGAAGAIANIAADGTVGVQFAGIRDLHALHIADPDSTDAIGYAAGDGGQVWITRDSGLTWEVGPNVGRTVYGVDEIGFGHR